MSDIRKRTAVNKCRVIFKCLNEVRLQSVFQKCCHSTAAAELSCINRLAVKVIAYKDSLKPLLEVCKVACKAEYSHYLGGNRYLEAVLTGNSVCL